MLRDIVYRRQIKLNAHEVVVLCSIDSFSASIVWAAFL